MRSWSQPAHSALFRNRCSLSCACARVDISQGCFPVCSSPSSGPPGTKPASSAPVAGAMTGAPAQGAPGVMNDSKLPSTPSPEICAQLRKGRVMRGKGVSEPAIKGQSTLLAMGTIAWTSRKVSRGAKGVNRVGKSSGGT